MNICFLILFFSIVAVSASTSSNSSSSVQCLPQQHNEPHLISRLAFGSCNNPARVGMWSVMEKYQPNQLILLGDNMYADKKVRFGVFEAASEADLKYWYGLLDEDRNFRSLVDSMGGFESLIATWDDHDFGINDGDGNYPLRNVSKQLFLDFFRVPEDDRRREIGRLDGVYSAKTVRTSSSFSYKIILLDTRFNKDAYSVKGGDFLGSAQWKWLEEELADESVDLILLGSSIQMLPTGKVVEEAWARFPAARQRLLRLLLSSPVRDVLLLSGDIHTAEILKVIRSLSI